MRSNWMFLKRFILLSVFLCLRAMAANSVVGLWHFDEGSGPVAYDSSGYGNHGQLGATPAGPSWQAGKFGSALHYNGTDDLVQVPHSASLSVNGSITLEAWVKLDNYGQPGVYIVPVISKWNDVTGDYRNYALTIYYGRVRLDISHDGNWAGSSCTVNNGVQLACSDSAAVVSSAYVALGRWTHVAGVFDSSTKQLQVFVNGVADTSVTAEGSAIYQNTDPLLIGAGDFGNARRYMPGAIDEARVWNRALSTAEVLSSAQAGLRGLWHFNSLYATPTVPASTDDSGMSNEAYMVNGATLTSNAKFGAGALLVNGSDYAVVGDTSSIDITGPITVEAWVNLNSFPNFVHNGLQAGFAPILAKWEDISGNYRSYALAVLPDGSVRFDISHTGQFSCGLFPNAGPYKCSNSDSALVISANKIALHTWAHIAGVYDGKSLQVFVNGAPDTSIAATGPIAVTSPYNPPIALGFANEGSVQAQNTDGAIDEVHLWARALSASEIGFDASNATAAELYLPSVIGQEGLTNNGGGNGAGAVFDAQLNAGTNLTAEFLEFLVPDAAGAQISTVDGHVSNGNGASLAGWVTGNNALDAFITGSTVSPPTLNFQINLSDKTKLHPEINWNH